MAVMRAHTAEAATSPEGAGPGAGSCLRLLLVGPLSKGLAVGGTSVSFGNLVRELRGVDQVRVEVIDTGREALHGARNVATGLGVGLRLLWRVPRAEVVIYNASSRGVLWLAPIVHGVCRLMGRPWVLRVFGGNLDVLFEAAHPVARYLSVRTTFSADLCLFQTRQLLHRFERVCRGRVEWFPTSRAQPTDSHVSGSQSCSRFVYVGRVSAAKGVPEIVAATDRLAAETGGKVTVDIYGPLVEGMTREELGGARGVSYRGELASGDVVATLRRYDALLLPTSYPGEGYPGVIVEAYIAGIPVIASRWRAIPEIVCDRSGILIAPRDADELYAAMRALVTRPQLYRRLRRGARDKRGMFCQQTWSNALVTWCRELVASRGGARRADTLSSSVFQHPVDGGRDPVVRDGAAAGGGGP
jgi:glycosyltransferase involved in cell wall biosynthesis